MGRRRLLEIEGFAIRIRFDPDRGAQSAVLTAVNGRRRELLLEVPNPFKSSGPLSGATNGDAALHTVSVRAHRHAEMCNRPHARRHAIALQRGIDQMSDDELKARVAELITKQ